LRRNRVTRTRGTRASASDWEDVITILEEEDLDVHREQHPADGGKSGTISQARGRWLVAGNGADAIAGELDLDDVVLAIEDEKMQLEETPSVLGNDPGVRLWRGPVTNMPYYYGPFDVVVLAQGQTSPKQAMASDCEDGASASVAVAVSLLRPGGFLIVQGGEEASSLDVLKPLERIYHAAGNMLEVFRVPAHYLFPKSPLYLRAKVVNGFGRGSRQLGFPTANMHVPSVDGSDPSCSTASEGDSDNQTIEGLGYGVYFGWAKVRGVDGQPRKAVVNIGKRPTFASKDGGGGANDNDVTIEVHLMHEYASDFYGEELCLVLLGFLRCEMKFGSVAELVQQIRSDAGLASAQLDSDPHAPYRNDPFFVQRKRKGQGNAGTGTDDPPVKRNTFSSKLLRVNAKWTWAGARPLMGWRHYRIVGEEPDAGRVEVMAVCDKAKRRWIETDALKKDDNWRPGWIDRHMI